ncbi:MAG: hypothetical protein ABIJ56_21265 [Pseudomonadota bacterium]
MKSIYCSILLVAAMLFPGILPAQTGGGTVVLLPAFSENVDSMTLQILDSALEEEAGKLGCTLVDRDSVAEKRPDLCVTTACNESDDFMALGKAMDADLVVSPTVKLLEGELTVYLAVYTVATGAVKATSGTTKPSGLLVKVKSMMKETLGEAGPPPAQPQPAPPVAAPSPGAGGTGGTGAGAPGVEEEEVDEGDIVELSEAEEEEEEVKGEGEEEEEKGQKEKEEEKEEKGKKKKKPDQKGRVPIVVSAALWAMLEGTGICLAADVDDWRVYLPVILLGGAAGAVVALGVTWKFKVTSGDAAMFDALTGWTMLNGLLIPAAAGYNSVDKISLGGSIGGAIGLAGGIALAALMDPYQGDAVFMSMVGMWTAAYGEMITGFIIPDNANSWFIAGLVSLDLGLLAGGLASGWVDISPTQSGVITLVGLGGAAVGAIAGVAFVAKSDPDEGDWKAFDGILLAGTTLGIIAGVFVAPIAEKKLKAKKKKKGEKQQAELPFFVYHSEDGWGFGIPAITPLTQGKNMGAYASILGGVF